MNLTTYDEDQLLTAAEMKMVVELVDFAATKIDLPADTEMSITFVSPEEIQKVNQDYRQVDRPTDVISFAIEDEDDGIESLEAQLGIPRNIGDLIIAPAIAKEHATNYGHSYHRELGYTVVHGFLHLNGYDHIKPEDEKKMIALQEEILESYGLKR
ncbi:metalloprotease [Agrilactobacillus composti DSM 18527 = JCM 14202]|uniref:Endoribonuclease YbeY n=1 Tax=Agrilactobacillus composti DSM 18527 = JCM 14202 TaxID=1423734 RepID=X0QQ81_9LACO|nr:rRNA maturation RNase YbeY [Agrilactobacillus composti]KRM33456.1 metalloprotease [Agrilactobacillus composti DSM 18527 = JCM 14202]GAF40795.1 metal-dependent hydrolase [Agrilactobacillus composti DSM 18527 = JCM 14202]